MILGIIVVPLCFGLCFLINIDSNARSYGEEHYQDNRTYNINFFLILCQFHVSPS